MMKVHDKENGGIKFCRVASLLNHYNSEDAKINLKNHNNSLMYLEMEILI